MRVQAGDGVGTDIGGSAFADVKWHDHSVHVHLGGPNIGQREAPIIDGLLTDVIDRLTDEIRVVVLDCSQVTLLSSLGLGTLVDFRNRARTKRVRVAMYGLSDELKKLFRLTGTKRLFRFIGSEGQLHRALAA